MDCRANNDVMFLPDEKFDFDVSLSPASSRGDEEEDEVFVDQVSRNERCVSVNVPSPLADTGGGVRVSWSPLTGEQLEAMCEEAHRLANYLQSSEPNQPHGDDDKIAKVASCATSDSEQFVRDTEAKLCVIGQPANALSPVKRQTFCVQDSPMKQLPPTIQRRLQSGIGSNSASSTRPATNAAVSTRPATNAAVSTRPATNAAVSTRPATNTAVSTRPATNAAVSTRPAANKAVSTRPAASTAASIRPAASTAASIRPATSTAASIRPAAKAAASDRPAASPAASTRPAANAAASTRPAANAASSTRPASTARLSTSSPVGVAKAKSRMMLQGKAVLGVSVVLPSKPTAPSTSCSAKKHRQQPPSKMAACWRRSPSRAESYEDLLSDSTSVASDISDSSLNSSLLGKCTLALPTKRVRNLSDVKAPPLQRKRMMERKNTSSSSSSVSSFNSSLSLSPAKGKLNSSLNRSRSSSTIPAPSSVHKSVNQNGQRRSNVYAAAEPASSTAGRCSLSTQARKLSTPLKRAAATPTKRVLERTASIPTTTTSARLQSGLKAKPKPQALAPPTTSGGVRIARPGDGDLSPDVSKMLKPKRMMSVSSVDSLPRKPSAGSLTPSAGSCRSLQVKARRPSALPTPLRSRTSTIPTTTPTNQTSPTRQPSTSDSDHSDCTSARRASGDSPVPTDTQEAEPVDTQDIQPFCLEEEEEETRAVPPATVPQLNHLESTDTGALSQGESEPSRNLIQFETTEERNNKTQEVLLFDLPAPTLQPQEKLLIDLTRTPELIRTSNQTCTTTQLIDLTSPLIKWSPEDQKENNAPLINLSF